MWRAATGTLFDINDMTALMLATAEGHLEVAKLLLEYGADVNTQNRNGWTALMLATRDGRPEIVTMLLEHGADMNIQYKDGRTAFVSRKNLVQKMN
jgi:ankyrin repeat protein